MVPGHKLIKNQQQIAGIKESAKINIAVLDYVAEHIQAGITTEEIDKWVYDLTTKMGGIPAPLNYEGFPKSVCTSVNNQVCHGIPSPDVMLREGDIINVDVSTILNGYYSDSSRMFCIGEVSPEKKRLVDIAKESLNVGLSKVKPWGFLGDMGQAINDFANKSSCVIVGRSSDYILRNRKDVINVFIYAPQEDEIAAVMKEKGIKNERKAKEEWESVEKAQHARHEYITGRKRGDRHSRDILINSSLLGWDETADMVIDMVERKFEQEDAVQLKKEA